MKKFKVTFSVDLDNRDDIRDTIIKLKDITNKLNAKWKTMEIRPSAAPIPKKV